LHTLIVTASLHVNLPADNFVGRPAVHRGLPGELNAALRAAEVAIGVVMGDSLHIALHEATLPPLPVFVEQLIAAAALDVYRFVWELLSGLSEASHLQQPSTCP